MREKTRLLMSDFFRQADLVLLGLCCASSVFGIVLIYSATRYKESNRYLVVQLVAMLLGVALYILFSLVDVEHVMKYWKWMFLFNVVFILLLIPFGAHDGTGNRAWLDFPFLPVSIGPAEVVKLPFTLLLAKQMEWLREEKQDLHSFRAALFVGGHTLFLCGLYFVLSRDMGNTLVFLFIFLTISFVAGIALRWFALFFAGAAAAVAAAWWLDLLPTYMKNRFIVLFDHSYRPMHEGWQQTRSLLTLGSGGIFGQGYLNGTQTQSFHKSSLPARWTDFIFSVAGEELGLIGCLVIMALLAAIIIRVLLAARHADTPVSSYVCVGLASTLIFQTVTNIGMCLFVMPVIGLTLPFFSYGGSSLAMLFAMMGVVSGIRKRSQNSMRTNRVL